MTPSTRPASDPNPADVLSQMVQRTRLLQEEAAHELRMATNPAELLAVQAALLMAGWQHSLQCTTELTNAWFALGRAGALPGTQARTPGH